MRKLLHGSTDDAEQQKRKKNISEQYFKDRFSKAVEKDPAWKPKNYDCRREVSKSIIRGVLLCCPEDVQQTSECKHGDHMVCPKLQNSDML